MWLTTLVRSGFIGALLLAGFVPSQSEACSGATPATASGVVPADGATGVPVNSRVFVTYSGAPYAPAVMEAITLQPQGGGPVAATISSIDSGNPWIHQRVLTPTSDLAPNTAYEVRGRVRQTGCTDCVAATPELLATFTTGANRDETPPTFAGATGVVVTGTYEVCDGTSCCGPYAGTRMQLQYTLPTDADFAGLRLYRDDAASGPYAIVGPRGMALCQGQVISGFNGDFFVPEGTYYLRAVDLAGNEDRNSAPVTLDCEVTSPSDNASPASSGCAAVPASGQIGILLIALAVLGRRRRI